jgi:hypothetical protein
MGTKLDTKIKWNKIPRDGIEKKKLQKTSKVKQIVIKTMRIKIDTNMKWQDTFFF